ncbi:piggyBac transposable element-derived protein 4-like [Pieris rapae]|uniref:piggyBac transposable element-derived protein 4-like n=1 Tax=Pieris rapae TaxID=64459 RepID=UPI001E27BD9C|nr:piggyBac transposable element-derived protein 4-like [Pieris rapae]
MRRPSPDCESCEFIDSESGDDSNRIVILEIFHFILSFTIIDESLLKWHGRLGFAQKILSKAAQVGVKTYELCESSSGYLWKFFVYVGKEKKKTTNDIRPDETIQPSASNENDNDRPNNIDDTNDKTDDAEMTDQTSTGNINNRPSNATSKIVYDLVELLLHRGHTLVDNFYNCPLLARCLKRQNTDCCGTLRLNREFVPDSLKTNENGTSTR